MKLGRILLLLILLINTLFLPGCWSYHDIESYLLVSGLSIDKDMENNKYLLTVEVMDFEMSGKETKQASRVIESEGSTIFDAIRNMISSTGKKLYWAHANIAIISQTIAREGITPVVDLLYRDNEIREELYILISKEKTARELLEQQALTSESNGIAIRKMLENQIYLAKTPKIETYELVNIIEDEGISAALPDIETKENLGKKSFELMGTAVFKSDKLAGFLDPDETKCLLFTTNKVNRGLIIYNEGQESQMKSVSLEIFKSKTKIWPQYVNGKLVMNIEIKPEVAIAEIGTHVNYINEKERDTLKRHAEASLKSSVINTIKKVQNDYDSDIFAFGKLVKANMPSLWKSIHNNWDDLFKKLDVNVNVDITIRNSANISKTIQKRD